MSILNAIANPKIADVQGEFEKGRKIGEQKLTKDLAGKILNETLGSKLGMQAYQDLQKVNPEAAMNLKKAIQTDSDSGTQYFLGLTKAAASIIDQGGNAEDVAKYLGPQIMLAQKAGQIGVAQRLADTVPMLMNPETAPEVMRNILATNAGFSDTKDAAKFSATTVSLPGGITVKNDTRGGQTVTDGAGRVLTGEVADKAIKDAENAGSERKTQEIKEGAEARQTAVRTSEIKQEFSERARGAAREQITLNQAMKLIDKADQGIQGSVKLQLSRIFPDIDVTNEAMLSQTLTGLALEQLQKFKGPTTDFEFGVTESIAGSIGDSKEANRARLASLSRANWFNQRESKQFSKYIAGGGDPDEFRFNFGERVKTKKGEFSLRDIQDTAVDQNMTIQQVLTRLNK